MLTNIILAIGDSKSTIIKEIGDKKKKQGAKSTVIEENGDKKNKKRASGQHGIEGLCPCPFPVFHYTMTVRSLEESVGAAEGAPKKGTVFPFQPLSLCFNHMNYYLDMPDEMKGPGVEEDRLQLLRDVSGSFRPRILTTLMGVSGAVKTTLMDVLAGRKTGGYIEGSINIFGYPKNQATFARVSEIDEKDEEALWWTAIKWLLTYDRLKKGVLRQVLDNRKVVQGEVDVTNLSMQDKKQLKESLKKIMRSFLGDLDTESTEPKNKATYRSWSEKTLMTKKAFLKQSINLGMLICEAFAQIEWA
ncbi:hypothetical protein Q3G72_028527 [Acer saccharum]|nr:hypothetical protein Q3G72_028527 [Acer saccharum]